MPTDGLPRQGGEDQQERRAGDAQNDVNQPRHALVQCQWRRLVRRIRAKLARSDHARRWLQQSRQLLCQDVVGRISLRITGLEPKWRGEFWVVWILEDQGADAARRLDAANLHRLVGEIGHDQAQPASDDFLKADFQQLPIAILAPAPFGPEYILPWLVRIGDLQAKRAFA